MKIAHFAPSILSIPVLLLACGAAFANPGQRGWRDEVRAMHQHEAWREPQAREDHPDNQAQEISGNNPQEPNGTADTPRKPGKMSAEERRALRRQIDEVGRDIYAPGR